MDDCFLRLPIRESSYEDQQPLITPFFRNSLIDPSLCDSSFSSNVGSMAHIIHVSAAWGESMAFIYRSAFFSSSVYPHRFEAHHSKIMTRLSEWQSNLPSHLTWSITNLDNSIRRGYIGTYISLHCLYHSTMMKLNRHLRFQTLPYESLVHNIRSSVHHARCLLQVTRTLAKIDREARLHHSQECHSPSSSSHFANDTPFTFSIPFTGHAILIATDILTSAGSLSDLPEILRLVNSGLEVVEELTEFWTSAKAQFRHIGERLKILADTFAMNGFSSSPLPREEYHSGGGGGGTTLPQQQKKNKVMIAWVIDEPIDTTFPRGDDLIYSMDRRDYLRALGIEVQSGEEEIVRVETIKTGGTQRDGEDFSGLMYT